MVAIAVVLITALVLAELVHSIRARIEIGAESVRVSLPEGSAVLPFARYAQLNKADASKYPGRIKAIEFPASASLKRDVRYR